MYHKKPPTKLQLTLIFLFVAFALGLIACGGNTQSPLGPGRDVATPTPQLYDDVTTTITFDHSDLPQRLSESLPTEPIVGQLTYDPESQMWSRIEVLNSDMPRLYDLNWNIFLKWPDNMQLDEFGCFLSEASNINVIEGARTAVTLTNDFTHTEAGCLGIPIGTISLEAATSSSCSQSGQAMVCDSYYQDIEVTVTENTLGFTVKKNLVQEIDRQLLQEVIEYEGLKISLPPVIFPGSSYSIQEGVEYNWTILAPEK